MLLLKTEHRRHINLLICNKLQWFWKLNKSNFSLTYHWVVHAVKDEPAAMLQKNEMVY